MANYVLFLSQITISCALTIASEPCPLQDFCVAASNATAMVNGCTCMDAKLAQPDQFFTSGLHIPRNSSNKFGSVVSPITVSQVPGLNTLGIALALELVHYQRNVGSGNAVSMSRLSSPGVITVASVVFGSNPRMPADLLSKAFQLEKNVVDYLQVIF
ncbi:hypothetical protein LguiB_004668 [Lonicera macranthoides]